MRKAIAIILLLALPILAQDKKEVKEQTKVEFAKEQLQKLQDQYKQADENFRKAAGEYYLTIQAIQQQAVPLQAILKEEEDKKKAEPKK